jgi:hypothetical protein
VVTLTLTLIPTIILTLTPTLILTLPPGPNIVPMKNGPSVYVTHEWQSE